MDSLLNSAMETIEALPLGPMELVVLVAVITVSLCYLLSKGHVPPPRQEVNTSSRSINSSNVCKQQQQRGMDTNDSTPPTITQDMTEQVHLNQTDSHTPTTVSGDDEDGQEDKSVPDFLSDASSTTTDSDTTAVGTTEQLPSKEHVMMDDNADLVGETTTQSIDMEPTEHDPVSEDLVAQSMEQDDQQDEQQSDDKMAYTQKDDDHHRDILAGTTTALPDADDEPVQSSSSLMDPTTTTTMDDTQQTAIQSVTENLDGAETGDPLFDTKNTNDVDMCNLAVIPESGATVADVEDDAVVGEKDRSIITSATTLVDTNDAITPRAVVGKDTGLVDTMTKDNGMVVLTRQEETTPDSASQRLADDNNGATTADNQPTHSTETIPVDTTDNHDATTTTEPATIAMETTSVVENSGDDVASPADPCDHDLNTAETLNGQNDNKEEVMVAMTTTTRSVTIGLGEQQSSVVTEDSKINGECLAVDEQVCEKASSICPVVEQVDQEESQLENTAKSTTTTQPTSSGQGDTMTPEQCTIDDTSKATILTITTTVEHDLPQTNTTTTTTTTTTALMVDNLVASVQPAKYEVSRYPATMHPNPTNKPKQDMSRIERIGQQRQPYIPLYKSRCTFWPGCTNNHCKYYHPFIECRNGATCEFGKKCVFLHPKDYNDYQKHASRKTKSKSNGKKQQQKPVTCREDTPKLEQAS